MKSKTFLLIPVIIAVLTLASCTQKPDGINQTDSEGQKLGLWVSFYPDSSIESKTQYKQGFKHGRETHYYPTGIVQMERDYMSTGFGELLHGREAHYYDDGTLLMEGFYKEGLPDSTWRYFYRDGTTELEANFSLGKKTGTWKYFDRLEYMEKTVSFEQYPTEWNNDLLNGTFTYYLSGIGQVYRAVWFQDQMLEEEVLEPLGYEIAKANGIIDQPEYDFEPEMP